jgi:predicted AAA+ superfamily ATPase
MFPATDYITFDHLHNVEAAQDLPERFLRRFSRPVVLDEIQYVPNLDEWMDHPSRGHLFENFVMMELVRTRGLVPGKDLFFYRDQNGVEIGFIVERKGRLVFIEAKSGETVDKRKLSFRKVVPLFEGRVETSALLACAVQSTNRLEMAGFDVVNPLKAPIEL